MQLCISFGTCYSATLLHLPHGVKGEEQTQTYFTATPTQKSKHLCSMCSACASGEGGVVQARPTVAHFTVECGRREASVAHYGQPSCSLSWLPLSIFAVGKTLFASFVDFVRRTAEVIYLPFPHIHPHFYIFSTVQRASCNVFCSCRQHILICFSAVSYAVSAAHLSASVEHATQTKLKLRFQFCFRFRSENRAKKQKRIEATIAERCCAGFDWSRS